LLLRDLDLCGREAESGEEEEEEGGSEGEGEALR